MFGNKKLFSGFTLAELLVAMSVIGVIAAMSIPTMFDSIQKRMFSGQLKNTVSSIQQLMNTQLALYKTTNLADTDFSDPEKLMTDKYFPIAQKCSTAATCWNQKYRTLNNTDATNIVKRENIEDGKTVKLKNGSILTYQLRPDYYSSTGIITDVNDYAYGLFRVDLNGIDKPNIIGRDVFWFLVSKKGKIIDWYNARKINTYSKTKLITDCKSAEVVTSCLYAVMENNWVIDY